MAQQSEVFRIAKEIDTSVSNFKKDSRSRKSKAYLENRKEKLVELTNALEKEDGDIKDQAVQTGSDYATTIEKANKLAKWYMDTINEGLRQLAEYVGQNPDCDINAISLETLKSSTERKIAADQEDEDHDESSFFIEENEADEPLRKLVKTQEGLLVNLQHQLANLRQGMDLTKEMIEFRIERLTRTFEKVEDTDVQIWAMAKSSKAYGYDHKLFFSFAGKVENIITYYKSIKKLSVTENTQGDIRHMRPKLPEISCPVFDGDYRQWYAFTELFKALIHNRTDIGMVEKMVYLQRNLSGEALSLVKNLALTENNYDAALKLLTDRYSNTRLIINAHLETMLDRPNLTQQTASGLKSMHDDVKEALQALNRMKIDVNSWNPILHFLITRKLDSKTRILYETQLEDSKIVPPIDKLLAFMQSQFSALEALGKKIGKEESQGKKNSLVVTISGCIMECGENHPIHLCDKFKNLNVTDRYELVKSKRLCLNCLRSGHRVKDCKSRTCLKCSGKHNTLLHFEVQGARQGQIASYNDQEVEVNSVSSLVAKRNFDNHVILATVMISIKDCSRNRSVTCRAILDSGSQVSFVTSAVFKKLDLKGSPTHIEVEGIGNSKKDSNVKTDLHINSTSTTFSINLKNVIVLNSITSKHPNFDINSEEFEIPESIKLADPEFYKSKEVGVLLGADVVGKVLVAGNLSLGDNKPSLQNTLFGWVVIGEVLINSSNRYFCGIVTTNEARRKDARKKMIQDYWDKENGVSFSKNRSRDNEICEKIFDKTVQRNKDGRFVVKLPFVREVQLLGGSEAMALKRFVVMERRLFSNEDIREQYYQFMKKYIELGHMEEVQNSDLRGIGKYYLPHHYVLKPSSTTTKLRVVFDAAAATTSNISLNDLLAAGPKLQPDLFNIMLRFRAHKYVLSGDIEMMYRQINIHPADQSYQLIFWRFNPKDQIRTYKLKTVTYGTTSAPYLAVKCMQKLALEYSNKFPLASQTILNDFYMDDLITGSDSLEELNQTRIDIINILESGGFHLRKWCSNNRLLLEGIPELDCETKFASHIESVKILGIHWKADEDVFQISINKLEELTSKIVTKRIVLTKIAEMFDPLGIISPVLVEGKLLMQDLWALKLDWDEPLEENTINRWNKFSSQLHQLNNMVIPRKIFSGESGNIIEIHGFCDASKTAYGAVIYSRSVCGDNVYVNLVCSKSRVVPLRKEAKEISIPRLELNAAVLLSELMSNVMKTLPRVPNCTQYYTDSTTVLHWLHKCSEKLVPYVARRVITVQRLTTVSDWRYIASKNNPADIVSRGQSPSMFAKNNSWFEGPRFLSVPVLEFDSFPTQLLLNERDEIPNKICLIAKASNIKLLGINTKNNFNFLVGVMSIIIKFIYKKCKRELVSNSSWKQLAMKVILIDMQEEFQKDKFDLQEGKMVGSQSKLKTLSPFVDADGLVRVGGRIKKAANLSFDARHPIVLSNKHFLTYLLVKSVHENHLHVGPQALLYVLRQQYWPIRGRMLTKRVVNNCYRCFRLNPRNLEQIMGNLPSDRLRFQRPFLVCGLDYIGPVKIHHKVRGKRPSKAYVCVFVCFATKAVHIEVVSDLTTNAFVAALKRMIGRRGCPIRVYSDNGSNFKGAAREIEENQKSTVFKRELESRNIEWKFIPARSPHMGGLWEAAVRSIKNHLGKTVQMYTLTFEQLQTVMVEIEAILNSRPLTPLSEDPNDLQVLSPAHFLIGEPLTSFPERDIQDFKSNRDNWGALVLLRNEFWKRWTREYLSEMQRRSKWNDSHGEVEVGSLVLLKDSDLPTLSWRRARVISCIKGDDNRVRVVELKTSTGITKRSIHLVAPFPEEIQHGLSIESFEESILKDRDNNKTKNSISDPKVRIPENHIIVDENQGSTSQERSSRTRYKALVNLNCGLKTIFFILMFFIPLAVGNSIFQPIEDKSVLFFEDLGKSKVVLTNFKLIAFFSLDSYWNAREGIQETVKHLSSTCRFSDVRLRNSTSCESITMQLQRKLDKFEKLHNFIFHNPRQKRAVLKLVGALLHDITGILDEDTAEDYSRQIQQNTANQQKMVNMFKGLAALHNSTVNIMEENNAVIVNELASIRSNISSLKNMLDAFSFDIIITKTLLAMEEFQIFQQSIWESIRDVHSGVFNPSILDPGQLDMVVSNIRSQLPPSLTFPETNTFELLKLLKVKCSSTIKNIIFEIQIPLTGSEVFTMFQVHAFPVIVEDKLIIVHPSVKYLLVNEMQDRYLEMENDKRCMSTERGWLCSSLNEVFHVKNTKSCEIALFLGNDKDSLKYCEFSLQHQHEIILSLWTKNHWLVVEPHKQIFDITCDNKRSKETVHGRGVFNIQPGCQIKTSTSTIAAYEQEYQNMTFVTADLDWSLILQAANDTIREAVLGNFEVELIELKKLPKAPAESAFELPLRELHQFAISYTSLILIIGGGIGVVFLAIKFKGQLANVPLRIPSPSNHVEAPIFENEEEVCL